MENYIQSQIKDLKDEVNKLNEQVDTIRCRCNVLFGTCIVLTSVVTAMFMKLIIL